MPERWASGLARIRDVAHECGYAVAVHGSTTRDLDLIAAPWTPEATSADQLVTKLCEDVPLVEHDQPAFMVANPEAKPWGRLAWSLAGVAGVQYVDLSVVPRAGEPVPISLRDGRYRFSLVPLPGWCR
jgi:hypothetical protein